MILVVTMILIMFFWGFIGFDNPIGIYNMMKHWDFSCWYTWFMLTLVQIYNSNLHELGCERYIELVLNGIIND